MKLVAQLALALSLTTTAIAQTQFTDPANLRGERVTPLNGRELPVDQGPTGLAQLLRKLNTRASILNIVAHPDDEDGGMLTLYARGLGARVTDLSLTRGEGGQNAVTGDFEDALGLLRTQELLSNDRYTGVTQMFGTEVDFGFSKTKEEAFAKWTHDRVLYDAVRAIRLVRPLVITATFVGNVTDGHGQHQVSGEIAQEAFKAAADPNVFPDQIAQGLLPWQALRVYARVPFADINSKGVFDYATGQYVPARFTNYVTGKVTTAKPNADVDVPEGDTDPLLLPAAANASDIPSTFAASPNTALSYAQFARIGLRLQRSQISKNMTLPVSGSYNSGYTLYGSVLCNAPANARLPSSSPQNCHPEQAQRAEGPATAITPNLSSRPESAHFADVAERPAAPTVSPQPSDTFSYESAPTARPITAQGSALGSAPNDPSANGATYTSPGQRPGSRPSQNPQGLKARYIPAGGTAPNARSPQPHLQSVILSEAARASASSAAEGPATPPAAPQTFEPSGSEPHGPNFFTGIDTSIESIATLAPAAFPPHQLSEVAHAITTATNHFDPAHPDAIAPDLAHALANLDQLIHSIANWNGDPTQKANALHELRIKRVQLNEALALSLGLSVDATSLSADLIVNSSPELKTSITESSAEPVKLDDLRIGDATKDQHASELSSSKPVEHIAHIDQLTTITKPYFYRDNIEQSVYKLRDSAFRNAPATPSPLIAWATVNYRGASITIGRIVHHGPQPASIVPAFSIASSPTATVFPLGQTQAALTANLRTTSSMTANINVQSPHNWVIEARAANTHATKTDHPIDFFVRPIAAFASPQVFQITAQTADHQTYTEGFRPVGYPGLPSTNYYTPATTRIVPVDLKLPVHHHIAYLPGTGDAVPEALASIGLTPTILTIPDLTSTNLAQYDTVILGVRTYNAHPDLHGAPTQALLDYARNGGNVLVQYQTNEFTAADAPYPLSLGSAEKVVDEAAPVQLLDPHAPLLTTPNQITPADFNNWVEERGHGFLSTWDPRYTPLTETHDPGGPETAIQLPQRGGLITTSLGKGRWTYVAFALYRQLPEAVPGAFRLFVNLLNP